MGKKRKTKYKVGIGIFLVIVGICLFRLKFRENAVEWYEIQVVAHAGSGIDGKRLTNSFEAMNHAAEKGYRMIEVDFAITSDQELVLSHGWDEDTLDELEQWNWYQEDVAPDLQSFLETPICRKFTPMTAEDLIGWMKKHDGIYIVTDTKYLSDEEILFQFRELAELCDYNEKLLSRFVIQVYDVRMCELVRTVYEFPNMIYATYVHAVEDTWYWEQAAWDCRDCGISVILVSRQYMEEPYISILRENNLIIYTFTINTISKMEEVMNAGVNGIYSDYLTESDMQYIN